MFFMSWGGGGGVGQNATMPHQPWKSHWPNFCFDKQKKKAAGGGGGGGAFSNA